MNVNILLLGAVSLLIHLSNIDKLEETFIAGASGNCLIFFYLVLFQCVVLHLKTYNNKLIIHYTWKCSKANDFIKKNVIITFI